MRLALTVSALIKNFIFVSSAVLRKIDLLAFKVYETFRAPLKLWAFISFNSVPQVRSSEVSYSWLDYVHILKIMQQTSIDRHLLRD
jgi:hypothetical protein